MYINFSSKYESCELSSLRVTQGLRGFVKCTKREKCRRGGKTNKDNKSSLSETKNKYEKVKRAILDAVDDKQSVHIIEELLKNLEMVAKELLSKQKQKTFCQN